MSTQFSPYAQSSTASATWASGTSEAGSHDMASWPDYAPPAQSLSLSGESSGSHAQLPFFHVAPGQPYERRPSALSDVYAQSFAVPVAGITSAGSMAGIEGQGPMVGAGEAWQPQLLSQGQNPYAKQEQVLFDDWQYDKVGGRGEQMWLDEQRSQATASQTPSEAYYSA